MGPKRTGLAGWCAATILVSAFLLFQVQPVVSKVILPWFGGSPAVWTTCMLFFQLFLLFGYLYAHLLSRYRGTRWQGLLHLGLLAAALAVLPVVPEPSWKPPDSRLPQLRILLLLAANVGLPYFLLAASAPLVQAWFSRALHHQSPYRFYALSNLGSLTALLSYPFWIEPRFDVPRQGTLWSSGFVAFAVLSGGLALAMAWWNVPHLPAELEEETTTAQNSASAGVSRWLLWLLLPAFGSLGLLAVTNQICQDVAVVPFFWVVPLSLYLLSFILCFDSSFWYRRSLFALATLVVVTLIAGILLADEVQPWLDRLGIDRTIPDFLDSITLEATLYLTALFCVCMLCHGELVRSKPAARHLTLFYLCIAAGGALGGMFVALLCPVLFSSYAESPILLVGGSLLSMAVLWHTFWKGEKRWSYWWAQLLLLFTCLGRNLKRTLLRRDLHAKPAERQRIAKLARQIRRGRPWYTFARMLYLLPVLAGLGALVFVAREYQRNRDLVSRRNFYGVLRVVEYDWLTEDARRNLYNGRILHGVQFTEPDRRREPTTYYNPASGIGITLENLADIEPLHVATVGLGTGTIAAYAQEGDRYCFYEINPDVLDIAQHYFTFLSDAPAMPRLVLGDARLSMEQEMPQDYDVIALDAFSGDAIPTHLLTVEAVAVYLKHLKPSGVLAVHTSNRHLDLVPIVALLGAHYGLDVVVVEAEDEEGVADSGSEWLLVTRNRDFLQLPSVASASSPVTPPGPEIRVWTDQYSNLFQIMRALQKNGEEEEE